MEINVKETMRNVMVALNGFSLTVLAHDQHIQDVQVRIEELLEIGGEPIAYSNNSGKCWKSIRLFLREKGYYEGMQAYKWADIPEEQSVVICMRRFKEFEKGFIKACNEGDIVKANSYKQEYKYLNLKVEYEELKNFVYSYAQFCWGL